MTARVVAINRVARVVRADDGQEVGYDTLVLALGSSPSRLKLRGAVLPGVRPLGVLHAALPFCPAFAASGRQL